MSQKTTSTILPACPVSEPSCVVIDELAQLRDHLQQLEKEALTDALTGLFNYRHFEQMLAQEMERVRRSHQPLALLLADIDHFKRFNDLHGHDQGNVALIQVAQLIMAEIRQLDIACRFGGEEFVILLPATDIAQALAVAERIRCRIERHGEKLAENLTVSIGIAVYTPTMNATGREFLVSADKMLYAAKHQGRNRVVGPQLDPPLASHFVTAEEKGALYGASDTDATE
ncbi:MAG TPA: GGDEF domain-containing protein [Cellvibrionaceae bacterium]